MGDLLRLKVRSFGVILSILMYIFIICQYASCILDYITEKRLIITKNTTFNVPLVSEACVSRTCIRIFDYLSALCHKYAKHRPLKLEERRPHPAAEL